MVAPAVIVLIVVVVIAVLLFIIALALMIATANQENGSNKTSLLAAGAMIGIALPFIAVGALFGLMHFSAVAKGQKKASLMWLFIILSGIGALMVIIASIIGFAVGGNLSNSDLQRNVRAGGAMALIGGLFFVIAFILLLVLYRKGQIKMPQRKAKTDRIVSEPVKP